jgi:phospho-N-acetylmuramoyl-pentapeptide-transferase
MMEHPINPGLPALIGFITVVLIGKPIIAWLTSLKMGQSINTDAPESHMAKKGTPTMGGILFAIGVIVAIVVLELIGDIPSGRQAYPLWAVLGVFLLHMALGFLDDYLKVKRGKSLGLKAREKMLGQLIIAVGFVFYLVLADRGDGMTYALSLTHSFAIEIPKNLYFLYYIYVVLMIVGFSNFVNVTDGLDGLASGLSAMAFAGLSIAIFAGAGVLSIFGWALVGSLLGFLVFNVNPAKVFMGDTGSLALGSAFAAMALIGKLDIPIFIFGMIFVAEGLSVIIQVVSFKTTGKRVFKMAPFHHHFEKLGWPETHVVFRFWIAGAVCLFAGLLACDYICSWR